MKAIDYYNALKSGDWVPKTGDTVDYHPKIGNPAKSFSHVVKSVFPGGSGYMVAFISEKRGHVDLDALSEHKSKHPTPTAVKQKHEERCFVEDQPYFRLE